MRMVVVIPDPFGPMIQTHHLHPVSKYVVGCNEFAVSFVRLRVSIMVVC